MILRESRPEVRLPVCLTFRGKGGPVTAAGSNTDRFCAREEKEMKKVAALICLLFLVVSTTAFAAQPHWRIYLQADNGAGMYGAGAMTIAAQPACLDNYDLSDRDPLYWTEVPKACAWSVGVFVDQRDGVEKTWIRDVKSDLEPKEYPTGKKVWELRVASLENATYPRTRLTFSTLNSELMPPQQLSGTDMKFTLILTRVPESAQADPTTPPAGTEWNIPVPASHPLTFWNIMTNADKNGAVWSSGLKTVKIEGTDAAMIAGGYGFLFVQEPVPEPSGLLAFGSGIAALAGMMLKRWRA